MLIHKLAKLAGLGVVLYVLLRQLGAMYERARPGAAPPLGPLQAVAPLPGPLSIPLHPLEDYDFKSKADIYELRRRRVNEHPAIAGAGYKPSEAIFGEIVDGKPWWGIDGLIFQGPGAHSIDGMSRESVVLGNPFLLVGVGEPTGHIVPGWSGPPAESVFPTPLELTYAADMKSAKATYLVSNYLGYLDTIRSGLLPAHPVHLKVYNARDFGFEFVHLDAGRSRNVQAGRTTGRAVRIKQYIHMGGSCGHPDGCNNMSPSQKELDVNVWTTPATVVMKFWRKEPMAVSEEADLTFELEMR